tara:strand:- start:2414 stop:3907 length:1494 start_codon:yes stop_codon:yes gene_type:complete
MIYDIIIIGGGISGLNVASYSTKNLNKLLIEGLDRLGGRIHTEYMKIDNKEIWFDTGAARFSKKHFNLMKLLKNLKLKKSMIKYPSKIEYLLKDMKDKTGYEYIIEAIEKIKKMDKTKMNEITLSEFIKNNYGNDIHEYILKTFEYGDSMKYITALQSINMFKNNYNPLQQYYTLKNGLQMIINKLSEKAKRNNTEIMTNTFVKDVKKINNLFVVEVGESSKKISCRKVIFACPPNTFKQFSLIKENDLNLDVIKYYSLNRVYGYFKNNSWNNFERIVVDNKLKYLLSINKNVVLTSYTEGAESKYWLNKTLDGKLEETTVKLLKDTFEEKIENPVVIKNYHWNNALGNWKKNVDYKSLYKKFINPLKDVFICGDILSLCQDWMEGALQTSNKVIKLLNKRKNKTQKAGNKLRKISINEVNKHNKRDDAWISIDNKVYNITSFIDKHPGGDVILKGIGKNSTELFNNVGHPDYVKKTILPKYLIGILSNPPTRKNKN